MVPEKRSFPTPDSKLLYIGNDIEGQVILEVLILEVALVY